MNVAQGRGSTAEGTRAVRWLWWKRVTHNSSRPIAFLLRIT